MRAAIRIVNEGGADMVKLDGAAEFPEAVARDRRAGIPVWAQFGITPHTAHAIRRDVEGRARARDGDEGPAPRGGEAARRGGRVAARLHELRTGGRAGGDSRGLDSRSSADWAAGRGWTAACAPFAAHRLHSRRRSTTMTERYANVARITLDAIKTYADDVRGGRQIRGAQPKA